MENDVPADSVDRAILEWQAQRPDEDFMAMAMFGRLSRIVMYQRAIFNRRHEIAGLTLSDFDVLSTLSRAPEHTLSAGAIADSSLLTLGAVSMRIDRLERDGMVTRNRSTEDRRIVLVSLTGQGCELIQRIHPMHVKAQSRLLSDLTDDEVAALQPLLRKVERSVRAHEEEVRSAPIGTEESSSAV
ncbi:MarR family winged helix-turn-helix transcriptional regulator [Janibacter cremeus]|uniref:DNA-binding MarR family transcriptional regulator n=1 Tax=Janibacter cremeus TaxID=1285192 RepID=A0A852VRI8_9MICO|nr:MarR family transcriptional regulator [Janibacter cremeus]NYF98050.1 DNA-binding MarR family transcriptional regulator [Janibacter cremeus]